MADAVLAILQDRELAQRMSMNARVKSEQFNWARVLPKWEALLEEI
jgi:glycosyltransferase involved in cell wall biosynthesis